MSLTRRNYIRIAVMIAVIAAMFIISGLMANAQAAEYKDCMDKTVNGVTCTTSTEYTSVGKKEILTFKTAEKTSKVSRTSNSDEDYYYVFGEACTNGNYGYYTVTQINSENYTGQTKIYKINLSTGKSTLIRTLGGQPILKGVYGTKIYYLTDFYDAKLKVYDTSDKTTKTVLKNTLTQCMIPVGRYIYVYDNVKNTFVGVDTHTSKLAVSSLKWNDLEWNCEGFYGTKIVYTKYISTGKATYVMDYNGQNNRKLCASEEVHVIGSYVYAADYDYSEWPWKATCYKIKISDGTKTKISEATFNSKTGQE